ncbi:MAG: hydantoinase/oxoprolinase family protein, partial [Planctomycetota bacterium]
GWTDSAGRKAIRRLKVLSSGLLRCRVRRRIADDTLQLDLPAEIHRSVRHPEQHVGDLPDHFFRTAELSLIVQGGALSMGTVERFESSRSEVTLRPTEDAARTLIDENAVIEIDCHCEAPVLATRLLLGIPIDQPLPPASVRLGTTRGTNALLTRTGASTALVVNQGFGDALLIGEQDRPELFDLTIDKGIPLADTIVEIRGRMNAKGRETETIVEREIEQAFMTLKERGVESIAICLLHAYLNPIHEKRVESIARRLGLTFVSRSSEVAPLIKFVARAETTSLDAYLNPILTAYVDRVRSQFGGSDHVQLDLMTSGGNLVPSARFRGRDSVLSGPAGGVIGLQTVASRARCPLAIGLDMGGTSTDVSRWNGKTARRYESRINGLRVLTPMMDIHTVAAGGGSICDFQGGRLVVGPESAGASPGPACYGAGGPLTVTDINLLLGRLIDSRFPLPLDRAASEERLRHVAGRMPDRPANDLELAEGFFEIAVTHMAEAVRAITTARGVDVRDHALIGFGGAAAQHVCRIADALGIRRIIDHPQASLLSALGMGAASIGVVKTVGIYRPLHETTPEQVRDQGRRLLESLDRQASDGGSRAKPTSSDADLQETFVASRFEADLRYAGTDASIAMPIDDWMRSVETSDGLEGLAERFHEAHQKRFGYLQRERPIEWVSLRCERLRANKDWERRLFEREITAQEPRSTSRNQTRVFCQGTMEVFDVLQRDELPPDFLIPSRSLVVSDQSTLVVEPGWQGTVANDGTITLIPCKRSQPGSTNRRDSNDAVAMEIVARRLQSIADSMGEVLRRTAVSVNVKERLDFSCAVFDRNGLLIA